VGSISLQQPTIGLPDTTEDVKVQNNFTTLQTVINGNLDSTNISPTAAIARSQLSGFGGLAWTAVGVNTSATDGHFYAASAALTITLPAPTLNTTIGVFNQTNSLAVAVTASSGVIGGLGLGTSGAASIQVSSNGAAVVLIANGTNWGIVSGQQDTGWVALTLLHSATVFPSEPVPSARLRGDEIRLKGALASGDASGIVATLPSFAIPIGSGGSGTRFFPYSLGSGNLQFQPTTAVSPGQVSASVGGFTTGAFVSFDGITYTTS
jgi:hypothetical protein